MKKAKKTKRVTTLKRGFLSAAELEMLRDFMGKKMTAEQIAPKMRRSVESIQKEMDKIRGGEMSPAKMNVGDQLRLRPEWGKWEEQFTPNELEQFAYNYVELMAHFENNVKHAEELQIFQVITLIIMIDRTLKEQKDAMTEMEYWREQILKERGKANPDPGLLAELQGNYEQSRAVTKVCADKYKTYSDKQDKMLETLKATRNQRIKNLEQSDKSYIGLIRSLMEEDNREKAGREIALMKSAAVKEKARLSKPHKYQDGTIDRPLLTPESVLMDDEEENSDD